MVVSQRLGQEISGSTRGFNDDLGAAQTGFGLIAYKHGGDCHTALQVGRDLEDGHGTGGQDSPDGSPDSRLEMGVIAV